MEPTSLQAVLDFSVPQLSRLNNTYPETTERFMEFIISDFVMFFNVGKTMDEGQLKETVKLMLKNYWYLRIPELKYCFDQAKIGKYGPLFNRIDGAVIFEIIESFLEERRYALEDKNRQMKHNSDEIANNALKLLQSKLNITIQPKKIEEYKPRERTEQEKLIDGFARDFDTLYRNNPPEKESAIRFVPYNGEQMDITQYMQTRLDEHFKPTE